MATAPAVPKKKSDATYLWFLIGSTLVLVFIFAALGTRLKAPGFLGTRATLGAGLVLVVEISLLAAMWYGRAAIRRGRQDTHKYVLTTAAVFHLVTVSFVMFVTFRELIGGPAAVPLAPLSLLALGHGMAGGLVDLVVLYILIRMWFTKYLPALFKIKNFKLLMQVALYAWTFMVLAGLSLFTVSYIVPSFGSVTQTIPAPLPAVSLPPAISPVNGSIGIRDDRRNSDAILITLQNVPSPPAGQTYVGWLIGGDGAFRLNVGVLTVDAAGSIIAEYVSPSGENLIERYDEFIITGEAGGVLPAQPSETIAFSAVAPSQARQQLRLLLANAPDTQSHTGYLIGLLDAGSRIEEHAKLAQEFGDRGSVGDARRQAEIIVNMLEGAGGKDFGDVDGDGRLLVDGDGVAFLPTKLDRVKQIAQAAIDAADASETIKLHAGHTIIGVDNARIWAEQLKAKALLLARISDVSVAKNLALDVYSLAKKLVHGVDMNNDGVIGPTPGEGTLEVAYRSAQVAASPASQATLNVGGQPLTATAVTPSPAPTGMPEPKPAPGEVIVKMKDMVFAPQVITVKAGTKITWVNEDNAPHTATADDNSWDTKTLTFGQSGSITFDKAGEFPYYCLFHGGPQGVGMAGNVIVTP